MNRQNPDDTQTSDVSSDPVHNKRYASSSSVVPVVGIGSDKNCVNGITKNSEINLTHELQASGEQHELQLQPKRQHFDSDSSAHSTDYYVTVRSELSDLSTRYESAESFASFELDVNLNIPTIVIDLIDSDSSEETTTDTPKLDELDSSVVYDTSPSDTSYLQTETDSVVEESTDRVGYCAIQNNAGYPDGLEKLEAQELEARTEIDVDEHEAISENSPPSYKTANGYSVINLQTYSNLKDKSIENVDCSGIISKFVSDELSSSSITSQIDLQNKLDAVKAKSVKENNKMRRRREEGSGDHDDAEEQLIDGELRDSYERRQSEDVHELEIRGDEWNIALLLALYLLQGIPLGLSTAIPMIIQNKGVSFKQQAAFSFTTWPFALKLMWAPLVDALYYPSFGRRKTWLVPAQYLIGLFMVFLSFNINTWLGSDKPQVSMLTWMFFAMNFLAATQDIAVDGWALTMLKRQNKSLASTCNTIGQNAGFFLGYVFFIALESPSFCNSYLRSEPSDEGLVTIPGFLYFWGLLYLLMTTLVALMKHEPTASQAERPSARTAIKSYETLFRIFKLSNIRLFSLLLLTAKIGFAAFDGVTSLKFIAKGVPKDKLAILAVPLVPLQIVLPIFITKMNNPRRPMDLYLKAYPYRLAFNFIGIIFVFITPLIIRENEDIPYYYYISLVAILGIHQVTTSAMFVQHMAFFAMVSDVDAGGTYMTLLNTLSNLGSAWTTTAALATVDSVTYYSCAGGNMTLSNDCSNKILKQQCSESGGTCDLLVEGYYVQQAVLTILGILWFWYAKQKIDYLQNRPLSTWAVPRR